MEWLLCQNDKVYVRTSHRIFQNLNSVLADVVHQRTNEL